MRVLPAPPDAGLRFQLDGGAPFPALATFVVDTSRATVLGHEDRRVSTIEHLLAALNGMGITNATIAVDGPEIPVADGSALPFVEAIDAAGIEKQALAVRRFIPTKAQEFRDGDRMLIVLPAPSFRIRMVVDFPSPIGVQYHQLEVTPETFRSEIAPSRTFGYRHEVEALLQRGLAMGGSLDNAVVFDTDGPMTPLRSANEPVRHKILDLIGDFALLGAYPQCEIIAIKSGHALHGAAVRALSAQRMDLLPASMV